MLTFLPFVRAVKAVAPELAVCALILGASASCAARSAARASEAPLIERAPIGSAAPRGSTQPSPAGPPRVGTEAGTRARGLESSVAADAEPISELELELGTPYPMDVKPVASDAEANLDSAELLRWNTGGSFEPEATPPSAPPSFHPGTRVVVDARWAKRRVGAPASPAPRGLTLQRVQAQLRSRGYWPFRACFEKGQRERPDSGGETRIAFTVGTRGKVRATRVLDTQLKNGAVPTCFARELSKLEFAPSPPRVLALVATVALWPGDVPLSESPVDSVVASEAQPIVAQGGDFDALEVRGRIASIMPQLRDCFADARRRDASLWGRLALAVTLEVEGSVHRVVEVESRFPNPSATRCVEARLASVVFPSVNAKPFTFVVPLRLAPGPSSSAGSALTPSPTHDSETPKVD